jgi:hypothetical protein
LGFGWVGLSKKMAINPTTFLYNPTISRVKITTSLG